MVKKYKPYLLSVLLACAVGALSGFLSRNGMREFQTSVLKPPLTPPSILFPIVWTILYVLMGLGAALVAQSPSGRFQRTALRIYALQLTVNFFWSILFFNFSAYFAAFVYRSPFESATMQLSPRKIAIIIKLMTKLLVFREPAPPTTK